MKGKMLNQQVFLEILCFFVFSGLLIYLVASGGYLNYVTPRMKPYLVFAAIVMAIWALSDLGQLLRPQYKVRTAHCFVLVIPFLLLMLPHDALTVSDLSGEFTGTNMTGRSSSETDTSALTDDRNDTLSDSITVIDPQSDTTVPTQVGSADAEGSLPAVLSGLDTGKKTIVISNDEFGLWMSELYMNMRQYEGYTVTMTGFVFKDSEAFGRDEFVPARMMMACCAADLTIAGVVCKYDRANELEAETWVTVEGILSIGTYEYNGQTYEEPQLRVTDIAAAEAVEGYVYPY